MKKLLIILLALSFNVFATSPFSDVGSSNSNYKAVNELYKLWVINWYDDGTFKPTKTVNRVEALKILLIWAKVPLDESDSALNFSDTQSDSWYAKYLITARNLWIVKGYSDGRFLPESSINLAECLKMVIESFRVDYDKNVKESPIPWVLSDTWFVPYFKFAIDNDLISQKSDPTKKVNRWEIAQIIYNMIILKSKLDEDKLTAEQYSDSMVWKILSSWEKYLTEDYTASIRDVTFWTRLQINNPANGKSVLVRVNDNVIDNQDRDIKLSKRAFDSIKDLNEKIIWVKINKVSVDSNIEPSVKVTADCSYPEQQKSKIDFFDWISLSSWVNKYYRENEVFNISWNLSKSASQLTVFIINSSWNKDIFVWQVTNWFFSIDIDAWNAWNKQIWMVQGSDWKSYLYDIEVKKMDCEKKFDSDYAIKPTNIDFKIKGDETYIKWNWTGGIIRFIAKQGEKVVEKYITKNDQYLKLDTSWFKDFSEWEAYFQLALAQNYTNSFFGQLTGFSVAESKKVKIVQHFHKIYDRNVLELDEEPSTFSVWGKIFISWSIKDSIKTQAVIATPSSKIEQVEIQNDKQKIKDQNWIEIYPSLSRFKMEYTPKESWTYLIELNHVSWVAGLNYPVYESWYLPLIPDYMDKSQNTNKKVTELNVSTFRSNMLWLLNWERNKIGLNRLMLNPSLNNLAQARAEDMATNNYVGHWDKSWKSANDLRFGYWIKNIVAENIAQEVNLENAHFGLMRSPIHRANILEKDWSRVWLGFALAKDWTLIVDQIYSSSPILDTSLNDMRNELIDIINSKRNSYLVASSTLHAVAQNWSEDMINKGFFDFTSPDKITLNDQIHEAWITSTVGNFIVANSTWIWVKEEVAKHDRVLDIVWKKIGIWIKQDSDWIIKVTLIYTY